MTIKEKVLSVVTNELKLNGMNIKQDENGTSYNIKLDTFKPNFAKATDLLGRGEEDTTFTNPRDSKKYFITCSNALEACDREVKNYKTGLMEIKAFGPVTYVNFAPIVDHIDVNDDHFADISDDDFN